MVVAPLPASIKARTAPRRRWGSLRVGAIREETMGSAEEAAPQLACTNCCVGGSGGGVVSERVEVRQSEWRRCEDTGW